MKLRMVAFAALGALSLAACSSPQDQAAEQKADALEQQAAEAPTEAQEKALNAQADAIEQQAGAADGGATPQNTPDTSPSK